MKESSSFEIANSLIRQIQDLEKSLKESKDNIEKHEIKNKITDLYSELSNFQSLKRNNSFCWYC
jgi:cell shape-determining protein MreC